MSFPLPRPVSKGSKLAIVAPAGPFDKTAFHSGVAWLEQRYEIAHSPEIFSQEGYLAGSDQRRLNELQSAIHDPSVDAILCARGGFGATRLMPGLDSNEIRKANKQIVGFSDISALHATWARAGVRSVHAPMVAALGGASEEIRSRWINALEHPDQELQWNLERVDDSKSSATGILLGGNLAVLAALNGTPFAPPLTDSILFIEDVGERPYRIDRMLTTLSQSGWFDQLRGIIIGAFTEGEPSSDGVSIDEVFQSHFGRATFPVLKGFSAGHISENLPIPFGGTAKIEGNCLGLNHRS